MIHNVFLITRSGEPILNVKLESIESSEAKVGGFIFSHPGFANQNIGRDIDQLAVAPYPLLVRRAGDDLLVIAPNQTTGWLDRFLDREKAKTEPVTA